MCVHVAVDVCVCVCACSCRCGRVRVLVLVHLQIDPERKVHTVMRVLIQNGKKKNMHTMIRDTRWAYLVDLLLLLLGVSNALSL